MYRRGEVVSEACRGVGGGGVAGKSEREKRVANRRSWTAVGSVTPQLCSTDLHVTRLYNPISLLLFIADKHHHDGLPGSRLPPLLEVQKTSVFTHVIFSWLLVDSCYSTEPDQIFLIVSLYHRLVPVGARQAVAAPPPPQPGDMCLALASAPLHSCLLACPDLSLIWWGERGICCLLWQRLAWENFTKNRQSCVCVVKTDYVRMRGGVLA